MESKQILSSSIEDILFENRNKAYGAYDLRQKYGRHVGIATAIAVSLLVLALISPLIIDKLTPDPPVVEMPDRVVTINELDAPPPMDETKPPPPPVDIPPPPKVIQFVPPVVTTEIVEDEPPTIEDIKKTATSNVNIDSDVDINYEPPPVINDIITKPKEDNTIYEFADEAATFKGDYNSYLVEHINYPPQAVENNIQGKVYVEIVIGKDGAIQDAVIKRDPSNGILGKEALRVVRGMPKWSPAKQNGNPVIFRVTIPIAFVLH